MGLAVALGASALGVYALPDVQAKESAETAKPELTREFWDAFDTIVDTTYDKERGSKRTNAQIVLDRINEWRTAHTYTVGVGDSKETRHLQPITLDTLSGKDITQKKVKELAEMYQDVLSVSMDTRLAMTPEQRGVYDTKVRELESHQGLFATLHSAYWLSCLRGKLSGTPEQSVTPQFYHEWNESYVGSHPLGDIGKRMSRLTEISADIIKKRAGSLEEALNNTVDNLFEMPLHRHTLLRYHPEKKTWGISITERVDVNTRDSSHRTIMIPCIPSVGTSLYKKSIAELGLNEADVPLYIQTPSNGWTVGSSYEELPSPGPDGMSGPWGSSPGVIMQRSDIGYGRGTLEAEMKVNYVPLGKDEFSIMKKAGSRGMYIIPHHPLPGGAEVEWSLTFDTMLGGEEPKVHKVTGNFNTE